MSGTVRLSTACIAATLMVGLYSIQAHALEGSFQLGINGGISRLTPDTDDSDFSLDDDQSTAFGAYVGLDITPRISAELAFTDLGEASLSGGETISYQAISLGAVAYVLGEAAAEDRNEGLSAFVRLGISSIDNDADIELDSSDNVSVWVGAGVQYPLFDSFGLRAELTSYDGDAQALLAGIYWRPGTARRTPAVATTPRSPEPVATPTPSPRSPSPITTPAPSSIPQPVQPPASTVTAPPVPVQPTPSTRPRSTPPATTCPTTARGRFSSNAECALLNSVVQGLDFQDATADITRGGQRALDEVVSVMTRNPGLVLEIRAHVQSIGNTDREAQLSALRARAVARYLVQNGVPVSQLSARAFGASQPLPDTRSAASPANNRIELRTP